MVKKLSRYFGLPATTLRKARVFNAFIGIDNKLFVDPILLQKTKTPEFKDSRQKLETYFADAVTLLKASKQKDDVAWTSAGKRLVFHEEHATALGYANAGSHGNAIGPELGSRLLNRGHEIVTLGVTDPVIFELIGLFEDDFGADRLSDMTVAILKDDFRAYTQRVTLDLDLKPRSIFRYSGGKEYTLPVSPDGTNPLLLVPEELLDTLPVALDPSQIDTVKAFNDELRKRFDALFAAAAKQKRRVTKADIRGVFFTTKGGIEALVRSYRNAAAKPYDFDEDPLGLFEWEEIGQSVAEKFPLKLGIGSPETIVDLRNIVHSIVKQFKKNIEENRLYETIYDEQGRPRKEVFSQRIFFSVADAYCQANNVDLSREPNAGNGPVDFKVSSGYTGRVLVEIKLSSNSHLVKGFTDQLPAYEKSEATQESFLVILRVTESDAAIREVLRTRDAALEAGRKTPTVTVIDARPTSSGSKR